MQHAGCMPQHRLASTAALALMMCLHSGELMCVSVNENRHKKQGAWPADALLAQQLNRERCGLVLSCLVSVCVCVLQETDEERGRRIASQWTNDPAAAASAVRGQHIQWQPQPQQQQQPQHAQQLPHPTTTTAHLHTDNQVARSSDGTGGSSDASSGVSIKQLSTPQDSALSEGRRTAAAAAGVAVARRAYVVVWAVLLVGCFALGGRRLVAGVQR